MANNLDEIFKRLEDQPRLLIEAELKPLQGDRFQPTGFPDLGAATYKLADGTPMLLVESAQSMANRLEEVCWDKGKNEIVEPLKGLQHVVVDLGDGLITSSILEAHRLNSIYILSDKSLKDRLVGGMKEYENGTLELKSLASSVFRLDPCSVLHGVFFARKDISGGRARLQRLLSSFIEARMTTTAYSGGVKNETVDPSGVDAYARYASSGTTKEEKEAIKKALDAAKNIPFPRTEYTAEKIIAYFNLDLATLRGYGLKEEENKLLIALSLFKIASFLQGNLRLRTACHFDLKELKVTRPENLNLPSLKDLLADLKLKLPGLIKACNFGGTPIRLTAPRINKEALKKAREEQNKTKEGAGSSDEDKVEGGEQS